MWATAGEPRDQIVGLYHRAWAHSDATIGALALDATGQVPWWPTERREVTLHQILVHMIAETHRHAGHADIVRELIDGAAGFRDGNYNMAPGDQAWWENYRNGLEKQRGKLAKDEPAQRRVFARDQTMIGWSSPQHRETKRSLPWAGAKRRRTPPRPRPPARKTSQELKCQAAASVWGILSRWGRRLPRRRVLSH